ncbi:unnamed protein product [Pleuronectes platessa]|uniref:Uncharacterized protein n=1 Tax=Pleuronectes platessa TaxID=8262 RepID=A0A9N7YQP0_PLEPL|nr:unnamed protein product [Pleuronectes platessa]
MHTLNDGRYRLCSLSQQRLLFDSSVRPDKGACSPIRPVSLCQVSDCSSGISHAAPDGEDEEGRGMRRPEKVKVAVRGTWRKQRRKKRRRRRRRRRMDEG